MQGIVTIPVPYRIKKASTKIEAFFMPTTHPHQQCNTSKQIFTDSANKPYQIGTYSANKRLKESINIIPPASAKAIHKAYEDHISINPDHLSY